MNPNLNAFLTQLKLFLVLIGGLMAEQGLDHTTAYRYVMLVSGSVLVVGNAAWALWASFANWRKAAAVGSQATLNMVAAGKALAADGTTITAFGAGTTPPKPVTVATAAEIVKDFASPPSAIKAS